MGTSLDQKIWPRCLVCFRGEDLKEAEGTTLCGLCRLDFLTLAVTEAHQVLGRPVVTIASYRGAVRRLILRAKVEGDHSALAFLEMWSAARVASLIITRGATVIVAAPSSLWSRLRGRLDLAHAAASVLAQRLEIPLIPAPPHLHWRVKKRASAGRRAERRLPELGAPWPRWAYGLMSLLERRWWRRWEPIIQGQIVLIVDDVITTGGTFTEIAAAMESYGASRVRGIAIASALE